MASNPTARGKHLLTADRGFATGAGLLAQLFAPGFRKMLDIIDAGLAYGRIDAELPDGEKRILGGRGEGPAVTVVLANWLPLVRLATTGSVGWYRAWTNGEWASPDPVGLFDIFMRNGETLGETGRARGLGRRVNRFAHSLRRNDKARARRNIEFHYDLGNDFYAAWLDPTMTYSSAIFATEIPPRNGEGECRVERPPDVSGLSGGQSDPPLEVVVGPNSLAPSTPVHPPLSPAPSTTEPLAEAQHRKLRLLLGRLDLKPREHLLELGCGWGGLMEMAAADYGAEVTGITLSSEQKAFAEKRLSGAGLADSTHVELVDYRDVRGSYDAIASVEMVEAVGREYWPAYLQSIADRLKPGGRAAIQLIAIKPSLFSGYAANADFIQTYIFPGGMLIHEPEFEAIARAAGLRWEDRTGYGLHYAETLRRWRESYDAAVAENRLPEGFDDRFHDLWRYYLMYCEGGFRGGGIDVAQVTLVKAG